MKTVKAILSSKGTDIWSVKADDTVFEAVGLMSDKNIGAVLVLNGEKLAGIVTERDYARKVVLEGKTSRDLSVSEVMTTHVLCVSPEQTVDECMALMTDKRARHLPVLDHKRVVGVVSIGDLVKAVIDDQQIVIEHLQNYIAGH
jgi:CBS domain-containing protein